VRELSTRATITATSFVNEYQWGDFKGSPDELMQRYYDAHLYFANWGTRSELAAGDLRPLYLAWLSGYGAWERDEDAFDDEDGDVVEPPVPAGLGSLTASQRALADFLGVAAETSPALPEAQQDPRVLAAHIAGIPVSKKDRLLGLVATGHATRARAELLRGFAGQPGGEISSPPRRTVAELLDAAWEHRQQAGKGSVLD
jgi:hypothetical protein